MKCIFGEMPIVRGVKRGLLAHLDMHAHARAQKSTRAHARTPLCDYFEVTLKLISNLTSSHHISTTRETNYKFTSFSILTHLTLAKEFEKVYLVRN